MRSNNEEANPQKEEESTPSSKNNNEGDDTKDYKAANNKSNKKTTTNNKKKKKKRTNNVYLHEGGLQGRWDEMFNRLVDYKRKHGHCLVPNRYSEDPSLGAWVSTQRRQYKILTSGSSESTPMTPERASRLLSIGFVWATKDPRHVPWETRFKELCDYKRKHGDCLVPIGFKENVQLSNWVSTQRQEYKLLKEGRSSRLSQERIKTLESIGFIWEAQRGGPRRKRDDDDDNDELSSSIHEKQKQQQSMMEAVASSSAAGMPSQLAPSFPQGFLHRQAALTGGSFKGVSPLLAPPASAVRSNNGITVGASQAQQEDKFLLPSVGERSNPNASAALLLAQQAQQQQQLGGIPSLASRLPAGLGGGILQAGNGAGLGGGMLQAGNGAGLGSGMLQGNAAAAATLASRQQLGLGNIGMATGGAAGMAAATAPNDNLMAAALAGAGGGAGGITGLGGLLGGSGGVGSELNNGNVAAAAEYFFAAGAKAKEQSILHAMNRRQLLMDQMAVAQLSQPSLPGLGGLSSLSGALGGGLNPAAAAAGGGMTGLGGGLEPDERKLFENSLRGYTGSLPGTGASSQQLALQLENLNKLNQLNASPAGQVKRRRSSSSMSAFGLDLKEIADAELTGELKRSGSFSSTESAFARDVRQIAKLQAEMDEEEEEEKRNSRTAAVASDKSRNKKKRRLPVNKRISPSPIDEQQQHKSILSVNEQNPGPLRGAHDLLVASAARNVPFLENMPDSLDHKTGRRISSSSQDSAFVLDMQQMGDVEDHSVTSSKRRPSTSSHGSTFSRDIREIARLEAEMDEDDDDEINDATADDEIFADAEDDDDVG